MNLLRLLLSLNPVLAPAQPAAVPADAPAIVEWELAEDYRFQGTEHRYGWFVLCYPWTTVWGWRDTHHRWAYLIRPEAAGEWSLPRLVEDATAIARRRIPPETVYVIRLEGTGLVAVVSCPANAEPLAVAWDCGDEENQ